MEFNSLNEATAFIRNALSSALVDIGEDVREIMNEQIESDIYKDHSPTVYDRTGALGECAEVVDSNNDTVTIEYMDKGGWTSFKDGSHFFPLYGYKAGSVLAPNGGRYSANPFESSLERCENEISPKLREYLISRGIPIE